MMKMATRNGVLPVASFGAALLASVLLSIVAGKFSGGDLVGLVANFPIGLVGLNARWNDAATLFFFFHPEWVGILAILAAYAVHIALVVLARRKGIVPLVVLECLIVLNGIGLFRMALTNR
jgi:hypothetical protein